MKENYQTTREETKKRRKDQIRTIEHQKTILKKIALSTYLSIITLNVNKLNTALKRHMVVEWIKKKNKAHIYAACRRLTSDVKTHID